MEVKNSLNGLRRRRGPARDVPCGNRCGLGQKQPAEARGGKRSLCRTGREARDEGNAIDPREFTESEQDSARGRRVQVGEAGRRRARVGMQLLAQQQALVAKAGAKAKKPAAIWGTGS